MTDTMQRKQQQKTWMDSRAKNYKKRQIFNQKQNSQDRWNRSGLILSFIYFYLLIKEKFFLKG